VLRTPPHCDVPRTRAPHRHCGNSGSSSFVLVRCPSAISLGRSPSSIAPYFVGISHASADAQAHRGIELARRFGHSRGRYDERALRLQIAWKRCAEDTRQQLTVFERCDHKPAPTSAATRSPDSRCAVLTVNGVRDIRGLHVAFCEVFQVGRGEHQRPVHLATRHTVMVCKSGCRRQLRHATVAIWRTRRLPVLEESVGLETHRKPKRGYGVNRNPSFFLVAGADLNRRPLEGPDVCRGAISISPSCAPRMAIRELGA